VKTLSPSRSDRAKRISSGPNTVPFARRPDHALLLQSVRVPTKSCHKAGVVPDRILIQISRGEHRVLDPDDVYYLRAVSGSQMYFDANSRPKWVLRYVSNLAAWMRDRNAIAVSISHVSSPGTFSELQEVLHRLKMGYRARETEAQKDTQHFCNGHRWVLQSQTLTANRVTDGSWGEVIQVGYELIRMLRVDRPDLEEPRSR